MPFKNGWITTINATTQLFEVCLSMGFTFLRTRSLNQDPLENSFASIRQFGARNTNPNCYQFISCFKTSLLNNLINYNSNHTNCESDDGKILENFEDFLNAGEIGSEAVSLETFTFNELTEYDREQIFKICNAMHSPENYEEQIFAYVAKALIKKNQKYLKCDECAFNLTTDHVEFFHTFTFFKEYDEKKRLLYVTRNVIETLYKIYDVLQYILPKYGHVEHLLKKIKVFLRNHVFLERWYFCKKHINDVENAFFSYSVILIVRKYFEDRQRLKEETQ